MINNIKDDLKRIFLYPIKKGKKIPKNIDYDDYWKERRGKYNKPHLSSWQLKRINLIDKHIKKNTHIIDLGSGDGAVLNEINKRKNIQGTGFDISDIALKHLSDLGFGAKKIDINNKEAFYAELPECDYALAFEIMEHLPNAEEFIKELLNKSTDGVFISIPNSGYYTYRLRLFFGSFPVQWVLHPGEHLRFWTVRDIKKWVQWNNFKLEKLYLYEGIPFLNKIWPSLFSAGMVIYLKKKTS